MNVVPNPQKYPFGCVETADDRLLRVARETVLLAEAEADIAAGRTVSLADVEAWIDSLGTDREKPVPQSGR